jgi:hypothetical protein
MKKAFNNWQQLLKIAVLPHVLLLFTEAAEHSKLHWACMHFAGTALQQKLFQSTIAFSMIL